MTASERATQALGRAAALAGRGAESTEARAAGQTDAAAVLGTLLRSAIVTLNSERSRTLKADSMRWP